MARRRRGSAPSRGLWLAAIVIVVVGLGAWWTLGRGGPKLTPEQAKAAVTTVIAQVKSDLKLDPRLNPYEITPLISGDKLEITGVVPDKTVHETLMKAIRAQVGGVAVDQLRELPDASIGAKNRAIVNIAVVNLGDGPGQDKDDHMVTQAVLGNVVELLEETSGWYRVQMHDHYLGWIDGASLTLTDAAGVQQYTAGEQAVITARFSPIYATADTTSPNLLDREAVLGTILPATGRKPGWVSVKLPDGRTGWLPESNVRVVSSIADAFPKGDAQAIINVAKQYVPLPYLWGGTTSYGFDCSGLTQFAYRVNGYSLPRDADMQYAAGEVVSDRSQLKPGDLVFFSTYKPGPSHVGIYMGNNLYVHSASSGLQISSFDPKAPQYNKDLDGKYLGARRFLK